MTLGDLVLLAGVVIGSMAALGAVLAVLLAWFRGSLRNVALLMAGAGGAVLLLILLTRLSPDALAMAVGLVFGMLSMLPAWGLVRAAADPNSRAHAREFDYLVADDQAGFLEDDGDYIDLVAIERNHKQLTGGTHERR